MVRQDEQPVAQAADRAARPAPQRHTPGCRWSGRSRSRPASCTAGRRAGQDLVLASTDGTAMLGSGPVTRHVEAILEYLAPVDDLGRLVAEHVVGRSACSRAGSVVVVTGRAVLRRLASLASSRQGFRSSPW